MSFIDKWLKSDIGAKVFKLIGSVSEEAQNKIKEADQELDRVEGAVKEIKNMGWRNAVSWVSDYLSDKPLNGDLKSLIDQVVEKLKFQDDIAPAKEFWQQIGQRYRNLFTKQLKDLDQSLEWSILGWQDNADPIEGPWKTVLNLGASANLKFAMQTMPAGTQLCRQPPPDKSLYFRTGLSGDLSASADVKGAVSVIDLDAGASVYGKLTLDYFYTDPSDFLVIEAAANTALHMPSPLSPSNIYAASTHRLKSIAFTAFGKLGTSVKVNTGKIWQNAFNIAVKSIKLNKTIEMPAEVKASYEASFNWQGNWDVKICPIPDSNKINITLNRGTDTEKASTFSLDASLGINGLDQVGQSLLDAFVPDAQPLMTKLQGLQNYGQTLKAQLKEKLLEIMGNPDAEDLKSQLLNVAMNDTTGLNVTRALGQKVEDAIDNKLDVLQGDAQKKSIEVLQSLCDKLDLKPKWTEYLIGKIKPALSGKIDEIKSQLEAKLKGIIDEGETNAATLLKPLEAVGTEVDKIVAQINTAATQLIQPLIDFLQKYSKLRQTISNAIKKVAQLKLGLHLGHKVESTHTTDAVLVFQLDVTAPDAGKYYRQMIVGNYGEVIKVWRTNPDGSKGVELVSGTLKDALTKTVTTDFSLNVLGLKFDSKTVFQSDITTTVDPVGNISMATGRAELTKYKAWCGESQTVRFVNLTEVAGTMESAETKALSTGFNLTYKDNCLEEKEVSTFLGGLETNGLLPQGTVDRAKALYKKLPVTNSERNCTAATINIAMPLTSEDIKKLVKMTPDSLKNTAASMLILTHFPDEKKRKEFTDSLKDLFNQMTDNVLEKPEQIITQFNDYPELNNRPALIEKIKGNSPQAQRLKFCAKSASYICLLANKFADFVQVLKEASQLKIDADSVAGPTTSALNDLNDRLKKALNAILKAKGKTKIYYGTTGFMLSIASICGVGKLAPALIPVFQWEDQGKEQKVLILKS